MNEEYEYERVEIKPGDQSWVGELIYTYPDGLAYKVLCVGEKEVFLKTTGELWHANALDKEYLWGIEKDFYIRKPKRKMVKKARALYIAPIQVFWGQENYGLEASSDPLTEEAAKLLYGHDLIKWPYGKTIEVEEGE